MSASQALVAAWVTEAIPRARFWVRCLPLQACLPQAISPSSSCSRGHAGPVLISLEFSTQARGAGSLRLGAGAASPGRPVAREAGESARFTRLASQYAQLLPAPRGPCGSFRFRELHAGLSGWHEPNSRSFSVKLRP